MTRKTGEFERIARILAPLARDFPGAYGLTDDAAVITTEPRCDLVVTTDTIVAGVHYTGDEAPSAVARKLLRVNLSDLAAMGATPLAYTLNLALPSDIDDAWLEDFADGLRRDQHEFGIDLAGGDSVSTPGAVTLTLTAFGRVRRGRALLRSGARPGDIVHVSGTIGDAAFGLLVAKDALGGLDEADRSALVRRYRLPEPRIALGAGLVGLASAAIDVSDGLVADLGHIAETSQCGAVVEAARVPRSGAARRVLQDRADLLEAGLAGGDDYELLITAPAAAGADIASLADELSIPVTAIGRIVEEPGIRIYDADGRRLSLRSRGWAHG